MNKKFKKIILAILILIISLFALREAYVGIYLLSESGSIFGEEKIKAFLLPSPESYSKAKDVLVLTDKAFSCINSDSNEFGALEVYSIDNENVVSEEHSIQLITAHFADNDGYMWVLYYHTGYNDTGDVVYGSGADSLFGKVLSRWELENIDNKWVVVNISEHP